MRFDDLRQSQCPGESLGGYVLGIGEIALGLTIIGGGFALEVVTLGGFTVGLGVTTSTGAALMGLGLATTTYHAQDIKTPNLSWKNTNFHVSDRSLPKTLDIASYKSAQKRLSSDEPNAPPYRGDELGNGTTSPDKGFEWKGQGNPGSSQGNWVKGIGKGTREVLHPDLDHKPPVGPHWDYQGPAFPKPGVRLYPDGTWENK